MSWFKKYFLSGLLLICVSTYAQFLPDNTSLNVHAVQRWMDSNRDFASVMQALEKMHNSDDDLKKFDALSGSEQDQKINQYLQQQHLLESAMSVAGQHGWKSVGEYRRLSTKLGNAIAAYFYVQTLSNLSEEQKKALRDRTDPVILNAPREDVAFVQDHEVLLKAYIQAYAAGR